MAEQNNSNASRNATNANGNSGGNSNSRTNNNNSNSRSSTKKKPKKPNKNQQQQNSIKFKGNDSDFENKVICSKATMAKEWDDLYKCLGPVSAKKGFDYLSVSIELMEPKADDCKEFKEKDVIDMDMTGFSKELEVDVAKPGKTPVMVKKVIVTNEILYKAAVRKLEEENKENRAKKNKYKKDQRLFLTSVEG